MIAQVEGIHFESGLTWDEVKVKAKAENKFIFVDCYATWCGPCKAMDEKIYPLKEIGDYYNQKFICVKIQMDKTAGDNEFVKKWYSVASTFRVNYFVNAYPTFLFFSADGKPIHKSVGSQLEAKNFIQLAEDAQNPDKQYYAILKNFQPNKIELSELRGLIISIQGTDKQLASRMATDYLCRLPVKELVTADNISLLKRFRDNSQVKNIAFNYIKQLVLSGELFTGKNIPLLELFNQDSSILKLVEDYQNKLEGKQLYEKDNLLLNRAFYNTIQFGDKFFQLYYKHQDKVDQIVGRKGHSQQIVDVIISEDISRYFKKADSSHLDVNWPDVFAYVQSKTDKITAERNIIAAQMDWYYAKADKAHKSYDKDETKWGELFANTCAEKYEKYGLDSVGIVTGYIGNDIEYSIYRYSHSLRIIKEAIGWIEIVRRYAAGPTYFGYVYSGLLYKAGYKDQAIDWQQEIIQAYKGYCLEQKIDATKDLWLNDQIETLKKMIAGEPADKIIKFYN